MPDIPSKLAEGNPSKGWTKASLGMVVSSISEKTDPRDHPNVPYVGLEHIKPSDDQLHAVGKASDVKSPKNRFDSGDILYGKLRPYLDKVALPAFSGVCSTDILVLRPEKGVENTFIEAILRSKRFIDFAIKSSSGINLPRTSFEKIASYDFWLPPNNEQKRISYKLRRLLHRQRGLHQRLEALLVLILQYRTAVLTAACTGRLVPNEVDLARIERRDYEPASFLLDRILLKHRNHWEANQLVKMRASGRKLNDDKWKTHYEQPIAPISDHGMRLPKGWTWASVEQCSSLMQYGTSAKTTDDPNGIPVLRMGNILDGRLQLDRLRYLPKSHADFPQLLLQKGDVLFNRTNSAELVGKTAVYNESGAFSYASYLIRLRLIEGCLPEYLAYFINSIFGRQWAKDVAGQVTGQANISGSKLAALAIPLPPIAEQKRIVAEIQRRLSGIANIEAQINIALSDAISLRASFFHRALEGKLVPQDQKDRSADELLNQIRSTRDKRLQPVKRIPPPPKMKKLSLDLVREAVKRLSTDRFSFDELSAALETEYDPLKDLVFELLTEPHPALRQVFDSDIKKMLLERITS